jgi:phospholipid/cholesterol/gamma-HCH transport system substrate-binding protein
MTDYNTLQRKRNIVVGGFVLIAVAAMLWLVAIFGELPVAATRLRSFELVVKFPSALGIQGKTPVYYLGYQIGKVISVQAPRRVDDEKRHQVVVGLAIDNKFQTIPMNVEFKVMKRSMGSSFVELLDPEFLLDPTTEDRFLRRGIETAFQGSLGSTNEFIPEKVQKKLEILVVKISSLAASIDNIVGDKENQDNIKVTLANFTSVTEEAAVALNSITKFTDAGTEVMTETSESLNKTLREVNTLVATVNKGEGTVSRLLNDGRLYENLLESSEELKLALEQFKLFAAEAQEKGLKIKL